MLVVTLTCEHTIIPDENETSEDAVADGWTRTAASRPNSVILSSISWRTLGEVIPIAYCVCDGSR